MTYIQKVRTWFAGITLRRWIQLGSLALANAYYFSFLRFLPCGVLNCSNCPLSTFTCPLILIQRGAVMMSMGIFGVMSLKILGSVATALAILLFFGAAAGTWLCGWVCPFGYLQDLLNKIPIRKFKMPPWSGHLRIPLFILLVALVPYWTRSLFFCDICPPGTITRLGQEAAGLPLFLKAPEGILAGVSIVLLAAVIGLALFTSRPFCSALCPIGGAYGLLNKVSGLLLKVDKDECTTCGKCSRVCPQGLDPVTMPNHSLCARCLQCTKVCDSMDWDVRLWDPSKQPAQHP